MTHLRTTLRLVLALAVVAWPAVSSAEPGPVHRALTGGLVDPAATTLFVAPPAQGMVIVYRDGQAVGWFVRAGYLAVAPNGVYGVVATRGTAMLFNAQLRLRPGLTRVEWASGDAPSVVYHPSHPPATRRPATPARKPPRAQAPTPQATPAAPADVTRRPPRATAPSGRFAAVLRAVDAADDDHDRYRALREAAAGERFTSAQQRQILGLFRSAAMREKAAALVAERGSPAPPRALPPQTRSTAPAAKGLRGAAELATSSAHIGRITQR